MAEARKISAFALILKNHELAGSDFFKVHAMRK